MAPVNRDNSQHTAAPDDKRPSPIDNAFQTLEITPKNAPDSAPIALDQLDSLTFDLLGDFEERKAHKGRVQCEVLLHRSAPTLRSLHLRCSDSDYDWDMSSKPPSYSALYFSG